MCERREPETLDGVDLAEARTNLTNEEDTRMRTRRLSDSRTHRTFAADSEQR
jgi:hypothetical protein